MRALLGAALFTLAGALLGAYGGGVLRARARRCGELAELAELLCCELERFAPPMPELFAGLAERAPGAGGELARRLCALLPALGDETFCALWERALEPSDGPERRALMTLGGVLGRYGAAEEARAAGDCGRKLRALARERGDAARERARLYVGLGAAAGALSAVLML